MTLHFGERTPEDGTIRCRRCGHGIVLRMGATVPRCYCGGDEFDQPVMRASTERARAPDTRAVGDERAERDALRRMGDG
jgi:DNA-directed RNA polymerase subunit RPC12/RpoP